MEWDRERRGGGGDTESWQIDAPASHPHGGEAAPVNDSDVSTSAPSERNGALRLAEVESTTTCPGERRQWSQEDERFMGLAVEQVDASFCALLTQLTDYELVIAINY
jgi:hypothetical protein